MAIALTVLYDEDCGSCTAVARRLAEHPGLAAAEIGGATGEATLGNMSHTGRYASFHVVDNSGRVSSAGEALASLLGALPAGRVTGWLARKFPRTTEALYRLTAKRRNLLGRLCRVDACRVDRLDG